MSKERYLALPPLQEATVLTRHSDLATIFLVHFTPTRHCHSWSGQGVETRCLYHHKKREMETGQNGIAGFILSFLAFQAHVLLL